MSLLFGGTQTIQQRSDPRLNQLDYQPEDMFRDIWAIAPASYATLDWQPSGGLIGDLEADVGVMSSRSWSWFYQQGGASTGFGFRGVTRDVYGSPLGGCTVQLFRTADNVLVDTLVSDPSGNFILRSSYYPDTHYIVSHKSGSPDVDGATVNTLIGT
jgi:hypothetical protein